MLTINQKLQIFDSFTVLKKKIEKDRIRVDYEYPYSKKRQRNVICQFNLNTGNGYVCGRYLKLGHPYKLDPRGWINIKNFNENQLKDLILQSIKSLEY